jgi:hypothetical protein
LNKCKIFSIEFYPTVSTISSLLLIGVGVYKRSIVFELEARGFYFWLN